MVEGLLQLDDLAEIAASMFADRAVEVELVVEGAISAVVLRPRVSTSSPRSQAPGGGRTYAVPLAYGRVVLAARGVAAHDVGESGYEPGSLRI